MNVDTLIVGQGLAGTLLSYFHLQQHKSFIVFDVHDRKSASAHSSGVINPITGRRFVKSWLIDQLLPFAETTYKDLEKLLRVSLVSTQNIKKIIHSVKEINDIAAIAGSGEFIDYIPAMNAQFLDQSFFHNPYGYCSIERSIRVDIPLLLSQYRTLLKSKNLLKEEVFNYDQLNLDASRYGDITFKNVVFCEGYKNIENPFFKYLPVIPNKGQYLVLNQIENAILSTITGAGIISPIGGEKLYAGATYEWKFEDEEPTDEGLLFLKSNIDSLLRTPYQIYEHKSGIRPTSRDRRPFLGIHPAHKNLSILNGFGAKGTSLAPYFGQELYAHLWHNKPLHSDVNLNRFSAH